MHITWTSRGAFAGLALAALSTLAMAGTWGPDESTLETLSNDATQSLLISQVLKDANERGRGRTARSTAVPRSHPVIAGSRGSVLARKLAAQYPPDRRAEVERTFRDLLDAYHQIEDRFGVPRFDAGGAVAAFLAGSLMAYRNEDFPDAHFKPLVEQMRVVVNGNPAFTRASPSARREMYEQMAILGMFMASTQMALKQQPDPAVAARMKRAAKGNLERFLGADADRVQITAAGLLIQ